MIQAGPFLKMLLAINIVKIQCLPCSNTEVGNMLTPHNSNHNGPCFRILRLHEAGLIQKWVRDAYPRHKQKGCRQLGPTAHASSMGLVECQGSFILLASGILMASVVLLAENMFHKLNCQKVRQRKTSDNVIKLHC
jgi:hypothetical protein